MISGYSKLTFTVTFALHCNIFEWQMILILVILHDTLSNINCHFRHVVALFDISVTIKLNSLLDFYSVGSYLTKYLGISIGIDIVSNFLFSLLRPKREYIRSTLEAKFVPRKSSNMHNDSVLEVFKNAVIPKPLMPCHLTYLLINFYSIFLNALVSF